MCAALFDGLKNELQRELELTIAGGGAADGVERAELADGGRAGRVAGRVVMWIRVLIRIGNREDGVIEEVECLKPELKFYALGDVGGLLGGEIKAHEFR